MGLRVLAGTIRGTGGGRLGDTKGDLGRMKNLGGMKRLEGTQMTLGDFGRLGEALGDITFKIPRLVVNYMPTRK